MEISASVERSKGVMVEKTRAYLGGSQDILSGDEEEPYPTEDRAGDG